MYTAHFQVEGQNSHHYYTVYTRSDLAGGEPCLLGTNMVMPLKLMVPNVGVEARGGSASVGRIARVHLIGTHRIPIVAMLQW